MAFNIDPSISLGVKGQQAMSLGDMLSIAGSAQAYKQRQQLNPLEIQKAQQELDVAKLDNMNKHLDSINAATTDLMAKPDLTAQDIINRAKEINKNIGGNDQTEKQFLTGLPVGGSVKDLKAWLAQAQARTLSSQARIEKLYPNVQNVDVGGQIVSQRTGNPLLAVEQPGTPSGPYLNKTLSPQTYTTETGAPGVIGGGGQPTAGNVNQPIQTNQPVAPQPQASVPQNMGQSFEAKGGLTRDPSETYEAYRERVKRLSGLPTAAKESLNTANIESIPNTKYTNDKILKLLDNPNLDIGPIQKAIVEKTMGVGLSKEQQEIRKYLEQRIRQEGSRSNQDQASQRTAYGDFSTGKGALREIIYNDKGRLASQELFERGILNHQGDPNKPNLAAINRFENKYSQMTNDPNVTHLLGVIGDKSLNDLTPTDLNHLKKQFGNLSKEQFNNLFKKLEELKNLSNESK